MKLRAMIYGKKAEIKTYETLEKDDGNLYYIAIGEGSSRYFTVPLRGEGVRRINIKAFIDNGYLDADSDLEKWLREEYPQNFSL